MLYKHELHILAFQTHLLRKSHNTNVCKQSNGEYIKLCGVQECLTVKKKCITAKFSLEKNAWQLSPVDLDQVLNT